MRYKFKKGVILRLECTFWGQKVGFKDFGCWVLVCLLFGLESGLYLLRLRRRKYKFLPRLSLVGSDLTYGCCWGVNHPRLNWVIGSGRQCAAQTAESMNECAYAFRILQNTLTGVTQISAPNLSHIIF